MKKIPVMIAAFILFSACAMDRPANILDLGFYEITKPGPDTVWTCDETQTANHRAVFFNKNTKDTISMSFYVLTSYEKQLGGEDAIIHFINRHRSGLRRFRYIKKLDLVIVFTLFPENAQTKKVFTEVVNSLWVHPDFPISPCLRLGVIGEQFRQLAEQDPARVTNRYAENLRTELNLRLQHHDLHCAGPINYLLGMMECYNSKWELYGAGFDSKKAIAYFEKAHEARPAATDPVRAIELVKQKIGAEG